MDTEQNEYYEEKIKKLELINKKQADEIDLLRQSNEMYRNFLKFHNGMNFFGVIVAVIALLLGVTAFLSVIK